MRSELVIYYDVVLGGNSMFKSIVFLFKVWFIFFIGGLFLIIGGLIVMFVKFVFMLEGGIINSKIEFVFVVCSCD